jgi:hypothetical protein
MSIGSQTPKVKSPTGSSQIRSPLLYAMQIVEIIGCTPEHVHRVVEVAPCRCVKSRDPWRGRDILGRRVEQAERDGMIVSHLGF